mmetsp:Transcript_67602/g.186813  ORF Transcript_67602/g.186813 Transcript_67602/m.186813 type:complete len:228 (+) Transcript_67602:200-883(+)
MFGSSSGRAHLHHVRVLDPRAPNLTSPCLRSASGPYGAATRLPAPPPGPRPPPRRRLTRPPPPLHPVTYITMLRLVTLALALVGASAFTPVSKPVARVAPMQVAVEDMAGVQNPVGLFDPMGLATSGNDETLLWFRAAELKHSRVTMLATAGWLVNSAGVFFPGDLTHGTKVRPIEPKATNHHTRESPSVRTVFDRVRLAWKTAAVVQQIRDHQTSTLPSHRRLPPN